MMRLTGKVVGPLWLLAGLCAVVATGGMSHASAQEKPAFEQAEPEGPAEAEDVPQATDERPRRRFRPFRPPVLTPEQREEAERLKRLGAKFGTDPTAIVGRVQLSSTRYDLTQGARLTDGVLRVDLPFRGNWLFRVDTPYRWLDPNLAGVSRTDGLGDLATLLGWRAYYTPEYAMFIGAISTFPTADETLLGSGKYTTGPFVATARFLPRLDSFLFGVFQYQTSIGGDPSRQAVSVGRAAVQINTIWKERWWTTALGVWQVNWEQNGKSSMTAEFEVGRNLLGQFGLYVRPGIGVWGKSVPGAYEWNAEVGVRYIFGSF